MRFLIQTTSDNLGLTQHIKYYETLRNAGFSIDKVTQEFETVYGDKWTRNYYFIEINDLEDLLKIRKTLGLEIILGDFGYIDKDVPGIEIYDDYRE